MKPWVAETLAWGLALLVVVWLFTGCARTNIRTIDKCDWTEYIVLNITVWNKLDCESEDFDGDKERKREAEGTAQDDNIKLSWFDGTQFYSLTSTAAPEDQLIFWGVEPLHVGDPVRMSESRQN